jgi:hypothetical protein
VGSPALLCAHLKYREENAELCIPSAAPAAYTSRYLLARAVIKRHLTVHLPEAVPTVRVITFASLESNEFTDYLHTTPIHFVMAHDGANKRSGSANKESDKNIKILFRGLIWVFNTRRLSVALLNQIEFRDSKVFTMILESLAIQSIPRPAGKSKFTAEIKKNRKLLEEIQEHHGRDLDSLMDDVDVEKLVEMFSDEGLSEGYSLAAYAVSVMLQHGDCDAFLASAFMMHCVVLKNVPISQRRLPLIKFDLEFEETIDEFFTNFSDISRNVMEHSKWVETMEKQATECDNMDLVDGRLFRAVLQAVDNNTFNGITEEAANDWSSLCEIVKKISGEDLSTSGTLEIQDSEVAPATVDESSSSENISVLPFSSPVFDKHLSCIHVTTDSSIPSRIGALKLYRETTHWHDHRKPLVQKAAPTEKVSKWR